MKAKPGGTAGCKRGRFALLASVDSTLGRKREAPQQPAAVPAAAAGRGHAAVGNQGGAEGVGLGAAGGAMPPPQYVPVPHRLQGRPPPVPQFGVAMMALTGEVESNSEEALLLPFAFHSNLTEGLGVNDDSSDVHYFVVDSGSNMIFVSDAALLYDAVPSNVVVTALGPEPLRAESDGRLMGYLEDERGERHAIDGSGTYIPGTVHDALFRHFSICATPSSGSGLRRESCALESCEGM
eukprot:2726052-Rhodomonas_salina.1